MINVYTYSQLGHYGALGNQLFQIAGVLSAAEENESYFHFPEWEYFEYFSIPSVAFKKKPGVEIDLYPSYLQDLDHVYPAESKIRSYFKPSEYSEDIIKDSGVDKTYKAVHVRRANNLRLPQHHPVCSLDYYEQALGDYDGNLIVFSDDLKWCRAQSIFKDARFGLGIPDGVDVMDLTKADPLTIGTAALDLHLMSRCGSHVISNSTFSWWAAWLSSSENVIYPSRWYGPALSDIDIGNLFPSEWERLEVE